MNITFFGTGAALNPTWDNTYFMIGSGDKHLFVDSGSGRALQMRAQRGEIPHPQDLFLTHCHSDHFLGIPHLLRGLDMKLTLHLSSDMLERLHSLCWAIGFEKNLKRMIGSGLLTFRIIEDGNSYMLHDWIITPIDLRSQKAEQYGFHLEASGKRIVFFGDEACNVMGREDLAKYENCDFLICESMCLENMRERFRPREKHHITAKEAGEIARRLQARMLCLVHFREIAGRDRSLQMQEHRQEAMNHCDCPVIAPMEGETFPIG